MFTSARVLRSLRCSATLLAIGVVAGCAQIPFFDSDDKDNRANTLTAAQDQARGGRDRAHASSQVSMGFGGAKKGIAVNNAQDATNGVHELSQAQTFIGTIACGPTNTTCIPVRLVITMHPDGIWRLRASGDQNRSPTVEQGCWHQTGTNPNRIILQTQNDTVLTDLSFISPSQVRVNVFNYVSPKLETHLSSQPDLDSISELENQTGPTCRP